MFGALISLAMGFVLSVTAAKAIGSGRIWILGNVERGDRPVLFWFALLLLILVSLASFASGIRQLT